MILMFITLICSFHSITTEYSMTTNIVPDSHAVLYVRTRWPVMRGLTKWGHLTDQPRIT